MTDNQPTVLVKKPDGSFVRVPLSDVKKSAAPTAPAHHGHSASAHQGAHTHAHHAIAAHKASEPRKAHHEAKPEAAAPEKKTEPRRHTLHHAKLATRWHTPAAFEAEDASSPLSEAPPEKKSGLTTVSGNRKSEIDAVLRTLPFRLPPDVTDRMRTIVQLYLKDIRGLDETRTVLMRPVEEGGVGLSKNQMLAVIGAAEEINHRLIAGSSATDVPPLKTAVTSPRLPKVEPVKPVAPQISPVKPPAPERLTLKEKPAMRPVMHDVVARPAATTAPMGPVDEIRALTVNDFRRLSSNPAEAASRVRLKFVHLKDESILQYLAGLAAWRESPLYLQYISTVARCLSSKQKISALTADKQNLQWPEIQAIVDMEKSLSQ